MGSSGSNGETVLKVAAEGGSLRVVRAQHKDGTLRFVVLRNEEALRAVLDAEDQEGVAFSDESEGVDTLSAALRILSQYPWHRLSPLVVHPEYRDQIMAEVFRLGGREEVQRWRREEAGRLE